MEPVRWPEVPVSPSARRVGAGVGTRGPGAGGFSARPAATPPVAGPSFARVLAGTVAGLHISEHARQRLHSAGVGVSDLEAVGRAVQKLAAHGGRESLVLCRGTAFLVSVRNRTLITVVPAQRMQDQIFTNIDSAALVREEDIPSGAGPAWEATGERRA